MSTRTNTEALLRTWSEFADSLATSPESAEVQLPAATTARQRLEQHLLSDAPDLDEGFHQLLQATDERIRQRCTVDPDAARIDPDHANAADATPTRNWWLFLIPRRDRPDAYDRRD